jgi:tetratricopeptide (TPR) repeat protein
VLFRSPVGEEAGGEASTQEQVRAFGSLAQEVMNAGVAGVVAMRYVLYVETAKRFVSDLYAALLQGSTLGEAVTFGRKQLASNPQREIAFNPIALQDWPVPIVYEAASIALFPKPGQPQGLPLRITLDTAQRAVIQGVPPPPDVGFYGRDETLLALDRAFDTQRIVLLHAYAGSGKTATAAEFARWYVQTGGIQGAVLFTSFEQYRPLPRALDAIEQVFGPALEQAGVHWLALSDADRCDVALQVLQRTPVLWIWDNVEPIAGFPSSKPGEGSEPSQGSVWSATEQKELVDFLRTAGATKAKFLLTSRRDERGWLGDLPRRLTLPPMPMQERVQLARALAEKYGHRITEVEDWRPLLRFTQGNPLAITVLVGQALRDGLKTRQQIEAFVDKLRKGEATFADEVSEGRSKSLGASLSYGFATAFNETERKQLALLHLFQGFVDVDVLCWMGAPEADWCLPEVRGLTREEGIRLLDRAAEIGLLTAHGVGYYSIHPALPWYFKSLFDQYYGQTPIPTPSPVSGEGSGVSPSLAGKGLGVRSATRAFVEAMGELGNHYFWQYVGGNRDVIGMLTAEEANLLQARQLARANSWWGAGIKTMQGLRVLYDHTGRRAEWKRLVEEIVPDFVDPAIDGPRPGREEQWSLVTEYRVRLAREARQWAEAERLQRACVEWNRRRSAPALAAPPAARDAAQKNTIRTLAASLEQLGHILREQGKPECVAAYQEAISLYQRIGDRPAEAIAAFNLGRAYTETPALRDLAQAERWYRRSLELCAEGDRLGRGKCLSQLGLVAYERLKEARAANQPETELLRHLNAAVAFYLQALDLTPPDAVDDLAVAHNQLGNIYRSAGDLDRALPHYREAIRYFEAAGDLYHAAVTRFNVALALAEAGRFPDALDYAHAALRNYETYGERAAEEIAKTQRLIVEIEEAMK